MNHILHLSSFIRPYGRRAALALLLLSSLVVMDLSIPRLIERIIDQGITRGDMTVVATTAAIMVVLSLLSAVLAVGNNYYSVQVGEGVARDLRQALFLKIQSFSYGNLDKQQTGPLMTRLTSDVAALKTLVQISLRIGTRGPLLMAGSLLLMFITNARLALTLFPLLLVTAVIIVFFIVKMEPLFLGVQQRLDRLNNVMQENIAGVRLVRAFVRADFEAERFAGANRELTARSIRVMEFMSAMSPALTLCVNIGMVVVIWSGGLQAIRGELTLGQIVAFTNYLLTTMTPLILLANLSNVWAAGIASAGRVDEVLLTEPEIRDGPAARPLPSAARGRVVFDDVSFCYNPDSCELVLRGINLTAEPGEQVAILGATGSGKSTLVNLIPRFYDAVSGRVLFDGIDVRELRQDSLRQRIGIVPQESILFSGTVRENIAYGRPEAADEEVVAAAKAAQAHAFIMELAGGYGGRVEQRGTNFSGGQKQRIAIARALLMKPEVLILDDSTSAVDVETETLVQDALKEWMRGRTSFVVAQRISTVLRADKILVLEAGRVAAQGTHRELLQSSPIYREIFDSQLGAGLPPEETGPAPREAGL
ncbi:MAG: ABC transporter ATP-binding protein [Anaerolineales bacterium]